MLATVADVISGDIQTKPLRTAGTPEFQRAVQELSGQIDGVYPGLPNTRWLAIRLLDGDARVREAILNGELAELVASQQRADVVFSRQMAVEGRQ
jgi:GTP-binding protein